jgi:anti-sigma factor RsiW
MAKRPVKRMNIKNHVEEERQRSRFAKLFFGASRVALRGLIAAVAMGIFFGLTIGIGGQMLQVDTETLYVAAGSSGWISGAVAMAVVFSRVRRSVR